MTSRYEVLMLAIQDRNAATVWLAAAALAFVLGYFLARPVPWIQKAIVSLALVTWFGLLIVLQGV